MVFTPYYVVHYTVVYPSIMYTGVYYKVETPCTLHCAPSTTPRLRGSRDAIWWGDNKTIWTQIHHQNTIIRYCCLFPIQRVRVPSHLSGHSHNMAMAMAAILMDRFGSNSKLSFYYILEAYILS